MRLKRGSELCFRQKAVSPVWPTCVTTYGNQFYSAVRQTAPAEQYRLRDSERLYRADCFQRGLARRSHFSVWEDKEARRADKPFRKKGDDIIDRPLDKVERLDKQPTPAKNRWQASAIYGYLHEWLVRFPDIQMRDNMIEKMEQDFNSKLAETKDERKPQTCPRCGIARPPGRTIHCAAECPKLKERVLDG